MERGTRVRNAVSGGDVIATRTAAQLTNDGAERVIQLVDFASRQLPDWERVLRQSVSAADSPNLEELANDVTTNMVRVGDCSQLVVAVRHAAADGHVTVTPLALNDEYDVVAVLAPQSAGATALFLGDGGEYLGPTLVWETQGAKNIGLHVSAISGTNNQVTLTGGALAEREA